MDKVKHWWRNLSLRKSLISYVIIFVLFFCVLYAATTVLCSYATNAINASYPPSDEKYYLTNEQGERLGSGVNIDRKAAPYSKKDQRILSVLGYLPIAAPPVYSALCILGAALLFYRNKLKKPLEQLRYASQKISDNDLDFKIDYTSRDELGQLCASYEVMRSTLSKNFAEMWQQVEERKRLNAAFAHDLRTPLTVLKGYDEILQASSDNAAKNTALTMGKHILRLEHYVESMTSLQRIEDAQPDFEEIALPDFLSSLIESAEMLCSRQDKKLFLHDNTASKVLMLDRSFITQVSNNLISNALRCAATSIKLIFDEKDGGLCVTLSDDGKGFSKDALNKAAEPYFTEEKNRSEHFGLGLYICRVLCEHHGGYLKIENLAIENEAIKDMTMKDTEIDNIAIEPPMIGAKITAFFKSYPL